MEKEEKEKRNIEVFKIEYFGNLKRIRVSSLLPLKKKNHDIKIKYTTFKRGGEFSRIKMFNLYYIYYGFKL